MTPTVSSPPAPHPRPASPPPCPDPDLALAIAHSLDPSHSLAVLPQLQSLVSRVPQSLTLFDQGPNSGDCLPYALSKLASAALGSRLSPPLTVSDIRRSLAHLLKHPTAAPDLTSSTLALSLLPTDPASWYQECLDAVKAQSKFRALLHPTPGGPPLSPTSARRVVHAAVTATEAQSDGESLYLPAGPTIIALQYLLHSRCLPFVPVYTERYSDDLIPRLLSTYAPGTGCALLFGNNVHFVGAVFSHPDPALPSRPPLLLPPSPSSPSHLPPPPLRSSPSLVPPPASSPPTSPPRCPRLLIASNGRRRPGFGVATDGLDTDSSTWQTRFQLIHNRRTPQDTTDPALRWLLTYQWPHLLAVCSASDPPPPLTRQLCSRVRAAIITVDSTFLSRVKSLAPPPFAPRSPALSSPTSPAPPTPPFPSPQSLHPDSPSPSLATQPTSPPLPSPPTHPPTPAAPRPPLTTAPPPSAALSSRRPNQRHLPPDLAAPVPPPCLPPAVLATQCTHILWFDGGTQGNHHRRSTSHPRDSGAGFAIYSRLPNDSLAPHYQGGVWLGSASSNTNNTSEYQALLWGLYHALRTGVQHLAIVGDSHLVVSQLLGSATVNNPTLQILHRQAWHLRSLFASTSLHHIYRSDNPLSDRLANVAISLHNSFTWDPTVSWSTALTRWQSLGPAAPTPYSDTSPEDPTSNGPLFHSPEQVIAALSTATSSHPALTTPSPTTSPRSGPEPHAVFHTILVDQLRSADLNLPSALEHDGAIYKWARRQCLLRHHRSTTAPATTTALRIPIPDNNFDRFWLSVVLATHRPPDPARPPQARRLFSNRSWRNPSLPPSPAYPAATVPLPSSLLSPSAAEFVSLPPVTPPSSLLPVTQPDNASPFSAPPTPPRRSTTRRTPPTHPPTQQPPRRHSHRRSTAPSNRPPPPPPPTHSPPDRRTPRRSALPHHRNPPDPNRRPAASRHRSSVSRHHHTPSRRRFAAGSRQAATPRHRSTPPSRRSFPRRSSTPPPSRLRRRDTTRRPSTHRSPPLHRSRYHPCSGHRDRHLPTYRAPLDRGLPPCSTRFLTVKRVSYYTSGPILLHTLRAYGIPLPSATTVHHGPRGICVLALPSSTDVDAVLANKGRCLKGSHISLNLCDPLSSSLPTEERAAYRIASRAAASTGQIWPLA